MKNQKSNKKKLSSNEECIKSIEESRTGGQNALRGFSYQALYSCKLILSNTCLNSKFKLEGLEDIDAFKDNKQVEHIQIKYSKNRQNAEYFNDILEKFLEIYLLDNSRKFKLVYDFEISEGNFTKLVNHKLDAKSLEYWSRKINKIKKEKTIWNWTGFNFNNFINKLSFENVKYIDLQNLIEELFITEFDITTDNIQLFANGIRILCIEAMESRATLSKNNINRLVQEIKDDIAKGEYNPAHKWVKKVNFTKTHDDLKSYFEGKKASPQDIANDLPIRRISLENTIEESIRENKVTLLKSSSGQGKTTLAYQVAHSLSNEFVVYQLWWCNEAKELENIVKIIKARVRIGEKPLIILDNLNLDLCEWNKLAQLLYNDVSHHYRLLLTSREEDWYTFAGDLSNVKGLNAIDLTFTQEEAQSLYSNMQSKGVTLHSSVDNWENAWEKVSEKQLLIEYVYLLTHGEMLFDRISSQINEINETEKGKIKCEILRKVSFADICGVQLPTDKLLLSIHSPAYDLGSIIESMKNEYLIQVHEHTKCIEGLHPVRSHHISKKLHEFVSINDTAISVAKIVDNKNLAKLSSNYPTLVINDKEEFYNLLIGELWQDDLNIFVSLLQGTLSGTIMLYYQRNKHIFDKADERGGLFLVSTESCPFLSFEEFNYKLSILPNLRETLPQNENISYFEELTNSLENITLPETDIHIVCNVLHKKLINKIDYDYLTCVDSYAAIAEFLLNIDTTFNLSHNISLEKIWENPKIFTLETMSKLMYLCFCGKKNEYLSFVNTHIDVILRYLQQLTKCLNLIISEDKKEIILEYIILGSEFNVANEKSVSYIKSICKSLPIFEIYSTNTLKPEINILKNHQIPDDGHKRMPIRNIFIMFHQDFTSLWHKTIMSNYEASTVSNWLRYWFKIRNLICSLSEEVIEILNKILQGKLNRVNFESIDILRKNLSDLLAKTCSYPRGERPFEEPVPEGKDLHTCKSTYFTPISNFSMQLGGFLKKDEKICNLYKINLRESYSNLNNMQDFFSKIVYKHHILIDDHEELSSREQKCLYTLLITSEYYTIHTPNRNFNKYDVQRWFDKTSRSSVIELTRALKNLTKHYDVVFPNKIFYENTLSYFPIVIKNFEISHREEIIYFLHELLPFVEHSYDLLVLMFEDGNDFLLNTSMRVSKKCLSDLKVIIDNDDKDLSSQWAFPLPMETPNQALSCFKEEYQVKLQAQTGYEGIDLIYELLWAYSKSREILMPQDNDEYMESILESYKAKIFKLLTMYEEKVEKSFYDELHIKCLDIFTGEIFTDSEFNSRIEILSAIYVKHNLST